jgi:hypothetical protein
LRRARSQILAFEDGAERLPPRIGILIADPGDAALGTALRRFGPPVELLEQPLSATADELGVVLAGLLLLGPSCSGSSRRLQRGGIRILIQVYVSSAPGTKKTADAAIRIFASVESRSTASPATMQSPASTQRHAPMRPGRMRGG